MSEVLALFPTAVHISQYENDMTEELKASYLGELQGIEGQLNKLDVQYQQNKFHLLNQHILFLSYIFSLFAFKNLNTRLNISINSTAV